MDGIGALFVLFGFVLLCIGSIWFIVTAFQESILWGLGVLFFHPVSLIFLILGWERAKRPFFLELLGLGILLFGALVLKAPIPGVHHHSY